MRKRDRIKLLYAKILGQKTRDRLEKLYVMIGGELLLYFYRQRLRRYERYLKRTGQYLPIPDVTLTTYQINPLDRMMTQVWQNLGAQVYLYEHGAGKGLAERDLYVSYFDDDLPDVWIEEILRGERRMYTNGE